MLECVSLCMRERQTEQERQSVFLKQKMDGTA